MMNSYFLFDVTFWLYLGGVVLYTAYLFAGRAAGRQLAVAGHPATVPMRIPFGPLATAVTSIGWVVNTAALVLRGIEANHVPWGNQFESMTTVGWAIILFYLIFEKAFRIRMVGAFVVSLGFVAIAAATALPYRYQMAGPLVPALNSYWLYIHVEIVLISYALFAIAAGLAVAFLLKERAEIRGKTTSFTAILPPSGKLDELSYRAIMFGFPLLILGIVLGAAWANYAWGGYWSWDPKETWALITWLIYAAYIHTRMTRGWKGRGMAIFAILAFLGVIWCYWGVNFILSGLHSYA